MRETLAWLFDTDGRHEERVTCKKVLLVFFVWCNEGDEQEPSTRRVWDGFFICFYTTTKIGLLDVITVSSKPLLDIFKSVK